METRANACKIAFSNIFSLAGPSEFPEVLGSDIQIVQALSDKICIFHGEKKMVATQQL